MDHKHEVVSITIHPNGNIVATSELRKPSIVVEYADVEANSSYVNCYEI